MSAPTIFASVVTNPGGTGSTIIPTLSTHAAGDVLEIFIGKTGNAAWTAPAGWTTKQQLITSGSAAASTVGTLIFRRVLPGDTLPLASPVCNLGATVTRGAICQTRRGTDVEGVHVLSEWQAFGTGTGTSNPIRPSSITTPAPEMEVTHYYCQRAATNAPEPTDYTQTQQIVISGTLVINVATRTIADQQTTLANQDASPTSGARWVAMISAAPSPDYPYYRSGSQAFQSNATSATPGLPAGTSSSDNRGNKDCIIATIECADTPTIAPNTPADWTLIDEWSNTTSGDGTTVRKYRTLYDGSLDRQFNRSTSGEIFVYFSVYHNAHQTIPIGTSVVQQNASSTTSTFPALSRTGTKATVQATCVADATPTFTAPAGWTERNDSQGVTCADQSFNATGTTASASFTLNSASPTLAGLMEVFSVASVINLILTPATATLTLTAFAPTIDIDVTVTPGVASLALTSFAPTVTVVLPFPQTVQLDTFNRANELPLDNGTWGDQVFDGDGDLRVLSNQCKGFGDGSGNNQGWLTQYGPDCEVYLDIVTLSGEDAIQIFARLSQIGGAFDGYSVRARGGSTNNLIVIRWDDGALTALLVLPQTVSDGDSFGMRLMGSTIEIWYKDVSVSSEWFLLGSTTDATYSAAGHLGLYIFGSADVVDNLGGGTVGVAEIMPTTASLTLTTFAPVLKLVVTPAISSLVLETFAPTISVVVTPAAASLTLTAFTPSLHESVTPENTSLAITTFAPFVTTPVTVTPTTAALTLTTFAPNVEVSADVMATPATANLVLTSFTAQLQESITPASQSLALTAFAPSLRTIVTPDAAVLSLNTFAPTLTTNTILTPGAASLTLTGFAATLVEQVTPGVASFTLSTFTPTVTAGADVTVTPTTAQLLLTGFAPALHESLTPSAATLAITTFAPEITISADIVASPTVATLSLETFAPSLRLVITPATSTLLLSTFAPEITISADRTVQPDPATLTLETFAPQLRLQLTPTTVVLSLSTFAPIVTIGGAGVSVTPATKLLTLTTYAPTVRQWRTPPSRVYVVELTRRTATTERGDRIYDVDETDRLTPV